MLANRRLLGAQDEAESVASGNNLKAGRLVSGRDHQLAGLFAQALVLVQAQLDSSYAAGLAAFAQIRRPLRPGWVELANRELVNLAVHFTEELLIERP
jgi:hypothetical protein